MSRAAINLPGCPIASVSQSGASYALTFGKSAPHLTFICSAATALSRLNLSRLNLSRLNLSRLNLSRLNLSRLNLSRFAGEV
jgi:uncharacterized protein YjbI with pentapeptide repeats